MVLSVEDRNFDLYLNFWDKNTGKKTSKLLSNISDKLRVAMSLETSSDDSVVFLGGCDRLDLDSANPVLSAFSFDHSMTEAACLELSSKDMNNVYSIKRLEGCNTLLISGSKIISIIEYDKLLEKFSELKQLRNIHSGPIYSFTLRNKDIFSVSPVDNYVHKF